MDESGKARRTDPQPARQRWTWRFLVLEAACWLTLARLALIVIPFRRLRFWIGPPNLPDFPAEETIAAADLRRARTIGAAVQRAATLLPFEAVCLPQAMAGKAMLRRRRIRTSLYLGVKREDESGLAAHAWLMAGDLTITGGAARPGFAELVRFD